MSHHCHARGCPTPCKPEFLMCPRHWRMVPRDLQRRVWETYRHGQCQWDPMPSEEWHEAASAAIEAVWRKECLSGRPPPLPDWYVPNKSPNAG